MAINESANGQNTVAITGTATGTNSCGVVGKGTAVGVRGESQSWHAVVGENTGDQGAGVYGSSSQSSAVIGESKNWMGVYGKSESTKGGAGVMGEATGPGVIGKSQTSHGVYGQSQDTKGGAGVLGEATGPGVIGKSQTWHGVYGETPSMTGGAGVWGEHKGGGSGVAGVSASGAGVYGKGGRVAGFFEGDVEVTGDIRLTNADCAEDFDIVETAIADPGTVMVLNEIGALQPSQHAYDKRVAGVVSGAGEYKPGIVLDKKNSDRPRKPVALLGKVFCKVDATQSAIEVGDLLTTSTIPGHAMKVIDSTKALGTIIGKALRPFRDGQGMIPILIALQ